MPSLAGLDELGIRGLEASQSENTNAIFYEDVFMKDMFIIFFVKSVEAFLRKILK